jgi:transposase
MRKDRRKTTVRYYEGLPRIRDNAAGMDIGAEEIWVDVGNKDEEGVRRFGTFTEDLKQMAEWLKRCGIETVAMESTGVYWIVPFQILEANGIEVFLVNARYAKNVHGRKTDMLDCQWLRLLHSYRAEHVFALKQSLELFDSYQKQIGDCDQQIAAYLGSLTAKANPTDLKPARREKKKKRNQAVFNIREEAFRISGVDLTQIDGISESAALALIGEIGVDMSPWKTEKQFASWLALCPNNKMSGGKILQRSTRKTANRARDLLRLCAQSLMNSKSALGAYCRRMCGRLGQPKGIVATAHKLALLIYRLMKFGRDYVDIGQEAYEKQYKERTLKRLARKAKQFGMQLVPAV